VFKAKDYIIEFNKLIDGQNEFDFELNTVLIETLSGNTQSYPLTGNAHLILQKGSNMYELTFQLECKLKTACDRCLKEIDYPVSKETVLLIKLSEFERYDDDEIIYVSPQTIQFDVSQLLYDTIIISLPIRKTCEQAGLICQMDNNDLDKDTPSEEIKENDPRWEKLKALFKKQ
jgi:uncharacterized protein